MLNLALKLVTMAESYLLSFTSSLLLTFRPKRRVKYLRRGLVNLGNTCFLNCVLQSLAGSPVFMKFVNNLARSAGPSSFSHHLIQVLEEVHTKEKVGEISDSAENVNPSVILEALRTHKGWYTIGEQQDSGEALNAVLSIIESEIEQRNSMVERENTFVGKIELLSVTQLKNSSAGLFDSYSWQDRGDGLEMSPFRSITMYDTRCTTCQFKKEKTHNMCYIHQLNLDTTTTSVQQLFSSHFATEQLSGVYCDMCTLREIRPKIEGTPLQYSPVAMRMGMIGTHDYFLHEATFESPEMRTFLSEIQSRRVTSTMERCLRIAQSPAILCLHLNRATFDEKTGEPRKIRHSVMFPFSFRLDTGRGAMAIIDSSSHNSTDKCCYSLVAVLVHTSGSTSTHFGHYYSCVLDRNGRWLGVSDRDVVSMTADQVARAPAFLLFYEKEQGERQ